MRLGRVAAGFAQCSPLPQQVPAQVQFDLNVCQAFAAFRSERPLFEKPVLFSYQPLNMGEYGSVLTMFFHGIPRWMQKGSWRDAQHSLIVKIHQALLLTPAPCDDTAGLLQVLIHPSSERFLERP